MLGQGGWCVTTQCFCYHSHYSSNEERSVLRRSAQQEVTELAQSVRERVYTHSLLSTRNACTSSMRIRRGTEWHQERSRGDATHGHALGGEEDNHTDGAEEEAGLLAAAAAAL